MINVVGYKIPLTEAASPPSPQPPPPPSSHETQIGRSCGGGADRPCCCSCFGPDPEGKRNCVCPLGRVYMFEKTLTLLPPLLLLDRSLLSRLRLLLRSLNRFKIVFLEETNQQQDFMEHSASVIITQKPINATEIKFSALPLF